MCTLRTAGFLLEHAACPQSALTPIIHNTNKAAKDILKSDEKIPENAGLMDATFEYLLNLSVCIYAVLIREQKFYFDKCFYTIHCNAVSMLLTPNPRASVALNKQ